MFLITGTACLLARALSAAPAPATSGVAVTPAKKKRLSFAVQEIHDLRCPPDRLEIEAQRRFGVDSVVYVLDACGVKVEIEEGLVIPASFTELERLSDEEMKLLAENLSRLHVSGVPPSVRTKVAAWCSEASARLEGESLADCQRRLPKEVRPVGADVREKGGDEYWYAVRNRPFTIRTGLYRPACDHLVLDDTPEACRCTGGTGCAELVDAREVSVRQVESANAGEPTESALVVPDGRSEFGVSYLRTSVSGNDVYRGAGFGAAAFVGVRFARVFAVAGGASLQLGLARQDVEWRECNEVGVCSTRTSGSSVRQVGIWVRGRAYPLSPLGFYFDAGAGGVVAWQHYRELRASDTAAGPAVLLGVGYETMMDERWSFGITVRQTLLLGSELSGSTTDGFLTLAVKQD